MRESGVMLFHADTGQYYDLDEMAALVWEMTSHPVSFEELTTALMAQFSLPQDVAERELAEMLTQMQSEDLIVSLNEDALAS